VKRSFFGIVLALLLCLGSAAPAFAEDAESLRNITLRIPGTDVSFTLENVFDGCVWDDSTAYLDYWVFFIGYGGSLTFNSPVTVTSEYLEGGELKDGTFDFKAGDKIYAAGESGAQPDDDSVIMHYIIEYTDSDVIYVEFQMGADAPGGGSSITEMIEEGFWETSATPEAPATVPAVTVPAATAARPTAAAVLIDGENKSFDAYNVDGNNYFKLRDLAYVLNGTAKQFEVGYDNETKAITLTSGSVYTAVGGEMTGKGGGDKTPTPTSSKISLDGNDVSFTAYNIEGNNYFKLRDIGEAFDFGVAWDGASNTIAIDTTAGYTPE
jgi:hypothetical protein